MNLEQLKTLVWVARLKGFAPAAEKLNATQPGISNRIRALEEELGVTLFQRTTRSVRITQEGRKCLKLAEQIVELAHQIKTSTISANRLSGLLALGASEAIALTWLSTLISQLNNDHPLLEIDIDVAPTPSLFERLVSGDLDLVLAGGLLPPVIADHYVTEKLGHLRFAWMVAGNSEILSDGEAPFSPADIQRHRIFIYSHRAYLHEPILNWFRTNGAHLQRPNRCDSIPTIEAMIRGGLGIGLLPMQPFEDEITRGELRVIPTNPPAPSVDYHATYPANQGAMVSKVVAETAKSICSFPK